MKAIVNGAEATTNEDILLSDAAVKAGMKKYAFVYTVYFARTHATRWNFADTVLRLRTVREDGKGYSGGHNTAERLGWQTYHPAGKKDAFFVRELADEGRFTGYHPYTLSYFIESYDVPKPTKDHVCECGKTHLTRDDFVCSHPDCEKMLTHDVDA